MWLGRSADSMFIVNHTRLFASFSQFTPLASEVRLNHSRATLRVSDSMVPT
jgi:hypothetical protein